MGLLNIRTDFVSFRELVTQRGFLKAVSDSRITLYHRLERLKEIRDDNRYGINTGGRESPEHLKVSSQNLVYANDYFATPTRVARNALSFLDYIHPLDNFTFVDFGSGKGRMLFIASEYKFKKIIGIEFSEQLHQVALDNKKNFDNPRQKCFDIEPILCDAVDFMIPNERCVLYFFSPFRKPVMHSVIKNIERSYRNQKRKIIIVYVNPFFEELVKESDCLKTVNYKASIWERIFPLSHKFRLFETID